MLKFKKLAAVLLATATITGCTVSVNTVQAFAASNQQEVQKNVSMTTVYDKEHNMKFVTNTKFENDPNDDKLTLLLSVDGSFIKSGMEKKGEYYNAQMIWPSAYECSIKTIDNDSKEEAQIVESNHTNIINSSQVNNTSGFSVGGTIGTEGKSINASYNESTSITYDKPTYTIIQNSNDTEKVSWKVAFSSTSDGYNKHSYHSIYGNQMFMRSRLYYAGNENLTYDEDLSTLITGGYSPKFSVVVKAPKDKQQSIVEITFKKQLDKYRLAWEKGANWVGYNDLEKTIVVTKKFVIDWEKHTVKSEEEVKKAAEKEAKEAEKQAKIAKEKEEKEIKEIIAKLNEKEKQMQLVGVHAAAYSNEERKFDEKVAKLQSEGRIERVGIFEEDKNSSKTITDPLLGVMTIGAARTKGFEWKFIR